MSGVQIPIDAKFDSGDVDKAIQHLTEQINKLGTKVAEANKIKFNPIDRATLEDLQRVQTQFVSLTKIATDFRSRLKNTGQSGNGFFDIDWARIYPDESVRSRQMRKAFDYVAAGTGASFTAPVTTGPGAAPSGGGRPPAPPPPPSAPPPGTNWWQRPGRNIVGAGLNALGPVGGVANGALSTGLAEGAMAGLAGLAGGLVALGIGKVIGAARERIGAAQTENIGYDTLKRQLGDVNVNFDALKQSLRAASGEIDVTFQEGQKLGAEFARLSGATAKQVGELAQEVRIGGGFGRSFGVDPAQSVAFFARMRQFGITSNAQDSQKLALTIGEAIAKSGAFAKADEVLQAIASYAAQQTRLGLTAANTSGYAGAFAGLVGAHIPGLDAEGSANLLSRVNSSIASGGGAGEAGQNFFYRAIGRRLGLDPIQTRILQEQGAFGTGSQTFGSGSLAALFGERYGVQMPAAAARSGATNLQLVMDQMRSVYAGRPELMLDAMHNLFGTSYSQSMALSTIAPTTTGALGQRLARLGINVNSVNATGISRLGQIEANGSLTDAQKDAQVRSVASQEQEKTEGSETRRTITGVANAVQSLADKAIPLLNEMRAGILFMAGDRGKMGPMAIQAALARAESGERAEGIKSDFGGRIDAARKAELDATSAYNGAFSDLQRHAGAMTPEQRAEAQKKLADLRGKMDQSRENIRKIMEQQSAALDAEEKRLQTQLDDMKKPAAASPATQSGVPGANAVEGSVSSGGPGSGALGSDAWLIQQLADTDRIDHLTPGTAYAQMMRESRFNAAARSKRGAMGLAQVMPQTLAALEKRWGRKVNPFDPRDAVLIQRALMGENMSAFGNEADALRAYNSGWDKGKWNNPETNAYVSSITQDAGIYGSRMPSGASSGMDPRRQWFAFEHNITLQNQNGAPLAPPITVTKQVGAPQASGS